MKEGNKMSKELEKLVSDLQGNVNVVSRFYTNMDEVAKEYGISKKELSILKARDIDGLVKLGLQKQEAVGALSNVHSSTCGPRTTRI